MPMQRETGTRYVVDLGELKLPDEIEKKLDVDIRRLVMQTLADIDFNGDVTVQFPFPPGRTLGIIWRPRRFPPDFPTVPGE